MRGKKANRTLNLRNTIKSGSFRKLANRQPSRLRGAHVFVSQARRWGRQPGAQPRTVSCHFHFSRFPQSISVLLSLYKAQMFFLSFSTPPPIVLSSRRLRFSHFILAYFSYFLLSPPACLPPTPQFCGPARLSRSLSLSHFRRRLGKTWFYVSICVNAMIGWSAQGTVHSPVSCVANSLSWSLCPRSSRRSPVNARGYNIKYVFFSDQSQTNEP